MTEQHEKYLIEKLKKGDKDAFRQLFEHYYPLFLAFAKRMLRDDYVAEDLIQNVFMRTWVLRERLDEKRSMKNYLLVAVRNEIYYYFRSEFKKKHDQLQEEAAVSSFDINSALSAKEMEKNIAKVIAAMPERRREIFEMSRTQKLSNAEIAERLGISIRTVEKHIENALSDIRHKLPVSILVLITLLF
ncbi:MAG: RNA polymerase sigma-70 factor [Bacteroidales bacterium]|nr:RNA polymerase sigma-70 factor [Bacteroidales bacterium]